MFQYLTLSEAEDFVNANWNARWNGWDIEIWKPHQAAFMKKAGRFNPDFRGSNKWGFVTTVRPDSDGIYKVMERRRK